MLVFLIKVHLDSFEIALFWYQTIPREILHLVNHESTKTNEGPKMTLIRPRPLFFDNMI